MCRRIFKEQTSETGDIPFYKIGTFGADPDAFISRELFEEYKSKYPYPQKGDILISASGSIGRTVEFAGNNEYFQDSNIVWLNHDERLSNPFLKCFYSVVKWAGIEGSTIKRLYNDNILNTVICMPSVPEQKRIGLFFENLDNLITLHQRQHFLHSTPDISLSVRLIHPFYTSSWEQRKLGDVVKEITRNDPESEAPIMMITANNGFIEQSERYAFNNAGESLKKYILLKKGELAYNHGASKLRPYGSCFALTTAENARIPFVYHCFAAENQNAEFMSIELNGAEIENQLRKIVSSGARMDGLLNISFDEYTSVSVILPGTEEQDRIADFFRHLDNLITLHQRKCVFLFGFFQAFISMIFTASTFSWEQRKVQDVADRFDNLRIPVAANLRVHGTTPYYGANGIQDYVEGFTHDGEFVLVAEDGANDLKNYPVKCVNGRIWVNNHAHILQGKAGIADNSFLAFAISQSDIESLLVGGGRAKLNAETLMSIEFRLPCLQEQYRIGEYLTQLDHLITLHQRECISFTARAGRLILTANKKRNTSSWEQRKLSEITDKVTEKNAGLQYVETFTNSAEFGIISQRDFFDHDIAKLGSLDGYYIVKNEDFVYNPRISTSAPVGPINRNKLGRTGVMSPLYTVFRPHDIDTTYLEYFFKCGYWHSFMNFNGDSGARSDRFSIRDNVFFQMPIPIPDIDEQRKIGELLTCLDNLITLHQRKPFLMKWRTSDANRNQTNRLVL